MTYTILSALVRLSGLQCLLHVAVGGTMSDNYIQRISGASRRNSHQVGLLGGLASCRSKCNCLLYGNVPSSLSQQASPCRLDSIMSVLHRATCTRVAMRGIYIQGMPAKALCCSWCILASQSRA
eukprot:6476431-Amphidinium_carterae.1